MTREATTLERFAAAIELARSLPGPADIYRAILTGSREVDDGLRAANYDGTRSGSDRSSHPEKVLASRHPGQFPRDDEPDWEDIKGSWGNRTDRARDDMLALRRATDRALDAIADLNDMCCSRGHPSDWDAALKDAHILCDTGYLQAALDVGRNADAPVIRFSHAIDTVRAVRDSWMAHQPQEGLGLVEREGLCRSHERIGVKRPRVSRLLCQQCWRDILDLEQLGEPVELQMDPGNWPTETMLKAREDGRTVLLQKERQTWLRHHGVDASRVQDRRRERRGA